MQYTNKFNLPDPVVKALTEDNYTRGESNRSVTQLIDSPRAVILKHEHDHEIVEDVSDRIWIALGNATHLMFEKYAGGKYNAEERLFAEVDGWTISGAVDVQHSDGGVVNIQDYKCTNVWSVIYDKDAPDGQWAKQLNMYAWLAEEMKGVTIGDLSIIVVLRNWDLRSSEKDRNYPQSPIMQLPIPKWPKEARDQYVKDRVRIHQEAEFERLTGGNLPLCTDEERWVKNDGRFAVKKGKNKRALPGSVCDSREEAEAFIEKRQQKLADDGKKPEDLWVDERFKEPGRCRRYCNAAPWCDQWQSELESGIYD